jgi:hypothetical protein
MVAGEINLSVRYATNGENTCTEENNRNLLERTFRPRFKTFSNFKNRSEIPMMLCGNISFSEFLKYFLYTPILLEK